MGCKHKYKKIDTGYNESTNINLKDLTRQGNASISGMLGKCPAIKKRGCR